MNHSLTNLTFYLPKKNVPCALPLFLANIKAGFPSPADDFIEKKIDLNEELILHPAATFFVRVEGQSMKGANIHPGDVLIVDRSLNPSDKKIVIAILNGEFTVKRIRFMKGKCFLASENPSFTPIPIEESSDFQIWGIVTYIIHKAF